MLLRWLFHMHSNSLFSLFSPFPAMDGPVVGNGLQFVRIFGFLHCIQGLCQGVISWLLCLFALIKLENTTPISISLLHKKPERRLKQENHQAFPNLSRRKQETGLPRRQGNNFQHLETHSFCTKAAGLFKKDRKL